MGRLAFRLALAMMAVAILTALIIVASQQIGFGLNFRSLPPEVQQRIQQRREREEASGVDLAANFRRTRQLQERALVTGTLIAAFVAAIIAILYARSISKPIERVSLASAQVAKGDLSFRILERSAYSSHEAKTLTDNFNQMATALESYESERRDMIASIAHDLRTPLTAMKLRLEALKEELVPLNQDEVSLLLSQTDLLDQLIDDLRTLSLADAGKLSLVKEEVIVFELISLVIEAHRPRAELNQVVIQLEGKKHLKARLDPTRFKQIISNLLDNAVRVSPEGSTVQISIKEEQNSFCISIKDEGPGIPVKLLNTIFDRYIKDKDTGGSSGLGLAIVQTLVNLHKGQARAFNHSDGGAVFEIILPSELTDKGSLDS